MWESELGSHTVRSHGARVARLHMHDWLILILLGSIIVVLNVIHPFYRYVGKDMMYDLKYPLKSNTVPVWFVPIYAVMFPIVVFLLYYLRRRDVYDLHHAVLGIFYSVLITGVLTDAIKDAVGRPRPNFYWRCFPDGKEAYDQWGDVICHGDPKEIREGHKSFPSGHTSWSFAGLGFLSLYLSGKIKVFDSRGHIAKLCVVVLPLLLAALVGVSRVDDYWHHWQDVFTGGLLGLIIATFCYLQFFPPPYHVHGWTTHAYLRVLEELRANSNNMQTSEAEVEIQSSQRNYNSNLPVGDLESGRRFGELEKEKWDRVEFQHGARTYFKVRKLLLSNGEQIKIDLDDDDVKGVEECSTSLFGKIYGPKKANFSGLRNLLIKI